MGLDMGAYTVSEELAGSIQVDLDVPDGQAEGLHEWRKHPNLHGWMEQLYRQKGGAAEEFNCVNVRLTMEDLDRLEADVRADKLPFTEGFFFGRSDGSEVEDDLEFIKKARQALLTGKAVFYDSWW